VDIRSQHSTLIGPPQFEAESVPLAEAKALLVDVHADQYGCSEVFIDDIFTAQPVLDGVSADRGAQAALLAIEIFGCPQSSGDTLSRDDLLSLEKAIAEGTPSEWLIILGWLLNTRRLLISLPPDKHFAWKADIDIFLEKGRRVRAKELESLIGRLQHVAGVVSPASHFLSRLRAALHRAETHNGTRLGQEERKDLQLWSEILDYAAKGVDMNSLTVREPDVISITDACEFQLGGYSLSTGRAWRWRIPPELVYRKSINFLEFLASAVGLLLAVHDGEASSGDCVLCVTDNTSSAGWLRKSNFPPTREETEAHFGLARFMASLVLTNNIALFSQWICGTSNSVADCLSRNYKLRNAALTTFIKSSYPDQVPENFKVSPLPEEISSFLTSWVQAGPPAKESPQGQPRKKPPAGDDGASFYSKRTWTETPSSCPSDVKIDIASSGPSPKQSGPTCSASQLKARVTQLVREQSTPMSMMWQRPLPGRDTPTQSSTKMETLRSFYGDN
jgi:hypothetical protein